MPSWRFWERGTNQGTAVEPETRRTASIDEPPPRPPKPRPRPPITDVMRERKRAELLRRGEAIRFDFEQAELALQPDNPWRERIDLLTEALATIGADRARLDSVPTLPGVRLPATPITEIVATDDEPAEVSFRIGDERFAFAEETDWAERGGAVVRGQLSQRVGDAAALIPEGLPPERRDELARHLVDSVFVFATDLRDRALGGEPMPTAPSLADLAQPCSECGGWRDWHGRCGDCARRDWERQQLRAEADRLSREQVKEEEERHQWAERLPFARRRLADIESELEALER